MAGKNYKTAAIAYTGFLLWRNHRVKSGESGVLAFAASGGSA
jgi:hypothetical protein